MPARRVCSAPARTASLAIVLALAALGCGLEGPRVVIVSPLNGAFTSDAAVTVSGVLLEVEPDSISDVRVDGVSVLPLGANQNFQTTVALDPGQIIHPIVAEVIGNSGTVLRHRVTVILGDSIADGDLSPEGIALRIDEGGLDELEPLVTSLVPLDLASLVPPGTLVVDNYCYQGSIFGCLGRVDALVSGSPPPSLSSFSLDLDPMAGFVAGDITLFDLFFEIDVVAVTGIGFTCHIDVSAATTLIMGDYGLEPRASDPEEVDVTQLGGVNLSFGSFSDDTDCDGFLGFIVEAFLGLVIDDLQNDFVKPGLEGFLNAVDAGGNTPIAAAVEVALEAIEIAGPIGEAVGVDLEAPMFTISEDTGGLTFGSDARITASLPDPNAVDLLASYHVDQAFPSFPSVAPNGQPYELAMCISASAFNQLLKAEIESGLLITSLTEFDFGSGPETITAGQLATILPQFAALDGFEPLRIDVLPTLAPIVTGEVGPQGELVTLHVGHLLVSVVPVVDPGVVLLRAAVDTALGLDVGLVGGGLTFALTPPEAQDIDVTLLENPLFVSESLLDLLLPQLLAVAIPSLADSLGSFPLPDFLGLQLGLVDVDRNGEFMSFFLDMTAAP